MNDLHIHHMKLAIEQARRAEKKNEVPVGAVVAAASGEILSRGHNNVIGMSDPTAHAEILALRKACKKGMNYRLLDSVLYVTIEPCVMCMGAIIHARVSCIVFGAADPKWGACGSLYDFTVNPMLNHRPEIISGVCETECREIIRNFFRQKRNGF